MEENIKQERRIIKISRKKVKRVVWGIVIILVLLFVGLFLRNNSLSVDNSIGSSIMPSSDYSESVNYRLSSNLGDSYGSKTSSISDTREFLKTNYSATIETRNVSNMVRDVKNIIKGSEGRVDQFNSSEKYGYVSFVVPKSNFETFRDEMESLTHEKLYTESISSENLLTEKQRIEEKTNTTTQSLESLTAKRDELTVVYTKAVGVINKEISRIASDLVKVRASIATEEDVEIISTLRRQETSLVQQQTYQKQKLSEENTNYLASKKNFDTLISGANSDLTNINKQDVKFADNIETVNGSVRVNWVSLWGMARIFSPIHPTIIIIGIIIILMISFRRKIPKIVME